MPKYLTQKIINKKEKGDHLDPLIYIMNGQEFYQQIQQFLPDTHYCSVANLEVDCYTVIGDKHVWKVRLDSGYSFDDFHNWVRDTPYPEVVIERVKDFHNANKS